MTRCERLGLHPDRQPMMFGLRLVVAAAASAGYMAFWLLRLLNSMKILYSMASDLRSSKCAHGCPTTLPQCVSSQQLPRCSAADSVTRATPQGWHEQMGSRSSTGKTGHRAACELPNDQPAP